MSLTRKLVFITATTLMTLAPMHYAAAQATSPQIISLTCDGNYTMHEGVLKTPINNAGMISNLANGTVSASEFLDLDAHITEADDSHVSFTSSQANPLGTHLINGTIDRVTGTAQIMTGNVVKTLPAQPHFFDRDFNLTCKVTNRQF